MWQPGSQDHAQPGYAISLSRRWLVEKSFGWLKQTGPLRQVKLRGLEKPIGCWSSTLRRIT